MTTLGRGLSFRGERFRAVTWLLGLFALALAVWLIARTVDTEGLARAWRSARAEPVSVAAVLGAYALAFVLRSMAWHRVLPGLPFGHALASIHISLAGNHLLPFRLGEALRVTSAAGRAGITMGAAAASTLTLRSADLVTLAGLGLLAGPRFVASLGGVTAQALVAAGALLAGALGVAWLRRLRRAKRLVVRMPGPLVLGASAAAWVLEAAVIWQAARWTGIHLDAIEAVLVTSASLAAQVVAVAPAGVGTYEAAATAALVALGYSPGPALAAAVAAHALKTAYSLATGAVAAFVPGPGLLGRLRLSSSGPPTSAHPGTADGGAVAPVVLFLPAHNEEATVGAVVRRAPREVGGHPVHCLVIDDGSTDGTAPVAACAGAEVVSLGSNHGLGAAVRRGLQESVARGAAAAVFCDADGEYAPEELEGLVALILDGRADYVVGSRFAGGPRQMRPHRRLGNVVLTRALSFVARRRITDGQSGYRALSRTAAASAEIIHDYNYAQVLTLDLLGKGFRYAEVPITYRFRQQGRSFVRLGRYLRAIVPAVWREVNSAPTGTRSS